MSKDQAIADAAVNGLAALDKLLEHRSRLGACVLLAGAGAISFTSLRELLGETDGNLGAHLRKLEEAGYVAARKEFQDRKPVTWYTLTAKGQQALKAHLDAMQAVIRGADL
ncbi:MAG TPA: transcriptional regulator [Gemmataceae bacterium]|jgi:DNA-binding MarR family transcriptional regulator|nr:transcriptional regulator [Gemmataceae bacterium]